MPPPHVKIPTLETACPDVPTGSADQASGQSEKGKRRGVWGEGFREKPYQPDAAKSINKLEVRLASPLFFWITTEGLNQFDL